MDSSESESNSKPTFSNQDIDYKETTTMISMIDKGSIIYSSSKKSSFHNIAIDDGTLNVNNNNSKNLELEQKIKEVTLTWQNVNVHLPEAGFLSKLPMFKKKIDKTHIIQNVEGIARPNEVLAIMGASGAGKTTLLNVLNFRNRGDLKVQGDIRINGQVIKSPMAITAISGYVQQNDLFVGSLKVKEHLVFQAMLKMDKDATKEERLNRVEEALHSLNLKKCENTLIGIPERGIKGISGGEMKRLSFASEIITNPLLLFCDEPTSGLDSYMALSIIESMKNLAKQGRTIICTIHQPSSEIFEMFDRLCLLAEGRLAFIGDLNKAYDFFSSEGYVCPKNYNPADYYISKLVVIPNEKESCQERINHICNGFEKTEILTKLKEDIEELKKGANDDISSLQDKRSVFKSGFYTQLRWLTYRNAVKFARDPFVFRIQFIQSILTALIFGTIYYQIKLDQQGVQNINGILFLFLSNLSFSNVFNVVNAFPTELPLALREHRNGMYSVLAYYISKILIDLPSYIFLPFIFVTISYWMAALNSDVTRFFTAVGILILVVQCAVSIGGFISAAAPSVNAALSLSGPTLVPMMVFSGFFLNFDSIPFFLKWLRYVSWFSYSNEALIINQWSGVQNIECKSVNSTRCFLKGEDVIDYLNMEKNKFNFDIALLIAIIIIWRILTFLILLKKSKAK